MKKNTTQNEEVVKSCAGCEHGSALFGSEKMLCSKKGIVKAQHVCAKYSFDPLKYMPSPRMPLAKIKYEP